MAILNYIATCSSADVGKLAASLPCYLDADVQEHKKRLLTTTWERQRLPEFGIVQAGDVITVLNTLSLDA